MPGTRRLRNAPLTAAPAAALLGVWALLSAAAAQADDFFSVRDQNPLLRGFYLPLPASGWAAAGGAMSATLLVSNTLNVEQRGEQHLFVDGESDALDLVYENALGTAWRYRLSVPVIHDSGGVLDSAIDAWHRAFGFSRGFRPDYPRRRLDYFYSGSGSVELNHAQTSLGDLAGDAGWTLLEDSRISLSLWGGLKAPTGSVRGLTSDGAWDGALWGHAALRAGKWQWAAELGVAQPFGDRLFEGMAHRTSGFARIAGEREIGSRWSLRAQLDGQSARLEDNELRLLGPSLQLSLGADCRLRGRWRLQMGFSEDAAVNTAPDITFFLGIHR